MASQSELLSHADGVGVANLQPSPYYLYNVRARDIVLAGKSKRAELIYRYMVAWVDLCRMVKKAI